MKGFERTSRAQKRTEINVIDDDDKAKAKDDIHVEAARVVANVIRGEKKKKRKLLFPHNFFQSYFPVSASVAIDLFGHSRVPVESLLCHGIFIA